MFIIPGILISIVTFPGVIVHELAHQLMCRFTKTPVINVCYFRFERPNGYVVYEKTNEFRKIVAISMGPFIVNSLVGLIIFIAGRFSVGKIGLEYFLMWLGISIIMHAFPSETDLDYVFDGLKEKGRLIIEKILLYPLAWFMELGTFGKVVWLDLGYSLLLVFLIDKLIMM